ncbi:MAG: threonine synthase [Clostridiales bacterium]|nr:threonine synthase [Clostridiales bacterium]
MLYTSTRDSRVRVTASQAIAQGISADGGLFVPASIPQVTLDEIKAMAGCSYMERAKRILGLYLSDFSREEITSCVEGAYRADKFSSDKIAPVVHLKDGQYVLELWHGPTCAFKDMALQLLPHLMTVSARKNAEGKTIVILVATSGDTGKAALEGFKDVDGTKIIVFYPSEGVSPMQKLQMTTQEGENVAVCAIEGNFDDAQNAVKQIFTDAAMQKKLAENDMMFSSANSINWGRLVPQIVYYFSAYCDLLEQGAIRAGDSINVAVPTGNFGNILAAYYAKRMGLPINRLICASNANNVLTDFIKTGIYDRNRDFYTTTSPSMDILISSNLERLLYHLSGEEDSILRGWMEQLAGTGRYEIDAATKAQIAELFSAGFCDDRTVEQTIQTAFDADHYLCDTHTAVAVQVYQSSRKETGAGRVGVIDSTASPYKFSASVLTALHGRPAEGTDDFAMARALSAETGTPIPLPLQELDGKAQRFTHQCGKREIARTVLRLLDLEQS